MFFLGQQGMPWLSVGNSVHGSQASFSRLCAGAVGHVLVLVYYA